MLNDLLPRHPDHPFVLIQLAQLEAGPVRKILDRHHNLHFMMTHASPFYQGESKPFINMFENGTFKAEWAALIADYSDRFIFALDNVFARFWMPALYLGKMDYWWRVLSALPDEHAHAITHGNAERLWRLAPKPNSHQVVAPWDSLQKLGEVGYDESHYIPVPIKPFTITRMWATPAFASCRPVMKAIARALKIGDGCRGFNGYQGNAGFADTRSLIGLNLSL